MVLEEESAIFYSKMEIDKNQLFFFFLYAFNGLKKLNLKKKIYKLLKHRINLF